MHPTLSIVIPAYNEAKLLPVHLDRLKSALAAQASRPCTCEIIVCDNNSTDHTAELATQAGAIVVFEPKNQIARARNRGAETARGDWLLFIDADSYPTPELIGDVVDLIEADNVIGAGATMHMPDGPWWIRWSFNVGCNAVIRAGRLASGAFLLCHADAFHAVGGFSEELYATEELDLVKRLKAHGKTLGKKFAVLCRHPFITSGRKGNLYGWKACFQLSARFLLSPRKVVRDPKQLPIWYDGKR